MNSNMVQMLNFQKSLRSCALDKRSLHIRRVNIWYCTEYCNYPLTLPVRFTLSASAQDLMVNATESLCTADLLPRWKRKSLSRDSRGVSVPAG